AARWERVDEKTYQALVKHAEDNLDHVPWYLTVKPDLGDALRAALAIQGAWVPRPGAAGHLPGGQGHLARRAPCEAVEALRGDGGRRRVDEPSAGRRPPRPLGRPRSCRSTSWLRGRPRAGRRPSHQLEGPAGAVAVGRRPTGTDGSPMAAA